MSQFDIDAHTWSALNGLLDRALDLSSTERLPWIDALDSEYDALKPRLRDLVCRGGMAQVQHQGPDAVGI